MTFQSPAFRETTIEGDPDDPKTVPFVTPEQEEQISKSTPMVVIGGKEPDPKKWSLPDKTPEEK